MTMSHIEQVAPPTSGAAFGSKRHRFRSAEEPVWRAMKRVVISVSIIAVSMLASFVPVKASLVQNGNFIANTLPGANVSSTINNAGVNQLTDWTAQPLSRVYLYFPGTATTTGAIYTHSPQQIILGCTGSCVSNPTATFAAPGGGNIVGIDSDFALPAPIQQLISTPLTIGQHYQLTFFTAAAQQVGFTGALPCGSVSVTPGESDCTTDYWKVSLGTGTDLTPVITNLPQGFSGWIQETLLFDYETPSTDPLNGVLSFLAVGNPSGLPPFAVLANVDLEAVPEPASLLLMGSGAAVLAGLRRRRRLKVFCR